MNDLAKWLMIIGVIIILIGALVWLGSKIGIPFGQLPGDIHVTGENSSFYFPIVTSIVVSIILTIIINIALIFFRK